MESYEKKYKEALERAKEIKSKILSSHLSTESCKAVSEYIDTIIPELAEREDEKEMRYCIEFINPCFPLLDNGKLNIRHLRIPDEHWAEMAITLILSFGGKIYALYRGNVKDGKLGEWSAPMIIDSGDWFSDDWLKSLPLNLKKKNEDVTKLCSNEWSEEDEKAINDACCFIEEYAGYIKGIDRERSSMLFRVVDKLKSLRPSWKPSEKEFENKCPNYSEGYGCSISPQKRCETCSDYKTYNPWRPSEG